MKTALRIFLLVVFGLGWCVFFSPVAVYGVFNIGNGSAMLLFGGLFLVTLFHRRFFAVVKKIWSRRIGKAALAALSAAAVVSAACAGVMSAGIVRAAGNAPPEGAECTVVVLGCRVYDSGPSLMLRSRINTAYDYLTAHPGAVCVLSGGQGEDEPVSEARSMFEALTEKGIDPARLYLEENSTSTRENLLFSMDLIRAEGLPENVALITNEYHEYRAALLAAKAGCGECWAVSAPSQKIMLPAYFVRELWGVAWLRLSGGV